MQDNKKSFKLSIVLFCLISVVFVIGCVGQQVEETVVIPDKIIAVKIYEYNGDYAALFEEWKSFKFNTVFVWDTLFADKEFRNLAEKQGLNTFVIFPVFYNEDLWENPDMYAITEDGSNALDEWVQFACPNNEDYRTMMIDKAKNIISEMNPDGLSIDFIRHFVFWEKVYPDAAPEDLPQACFDNICLGKFEATSGLDIPDELVSTVEISAWILENHLQEWADFKCATITGMVKDIVDAVKEIKPNLLINIHTVPWRADDFDGAQKIIAGQDLAALAEYADMLSPMTYSYMVKREPEWINSVVADHYAQVNTKIFPNVQVLKCYLEEEISLEEFRAMTEEAIKEPSTGIVLWSWDQISNSPEKKEIFKEIMSTY